MIFAVTALISNRIVAGRIAPRRLCGRARRSCSRRGSTRPSARRPSALLVTSSESTPRSSAFLVTRHRTARGSPSAPSVPRMRQSQNGNVSPSSSAVVRLSISASSVSGVRTARCCGAGLRSRSSAAPAPPRPGRLRSSRTSLHSGKPSSIYERPSRSSVRRRRWKPLGSSSPACRTTSTICWQ